MSPRRATAVTLVALFVVPGPVCWIAVYLMPGAQGMSTGQLADRFAILAFLGFFGLLLVAFFAGPTRSDMYVPQWYSRVTLRHSLDGRMDFSHASFPTQILAVLAGFALLGLGYAASVWF